MSDNAAELLIKIKTALEAGGLDAAKQKLNELTGATVKGSAATAESTVAASKHHAEMNKAAHTLNTVQAAAEGNVGALIKLTGETNSVSGSLAKAIPVVGAFWAGWEGGKKIGDWLWKVFVSGVKDVGESAIKTKDQFKELNAVKLEKLLEQLDKIEQSLQRSLADLNSVESRTKAEAAAVTGKKIAEVEASDKTDEQKKKEIAEITVSAKKAEIDTTQEMSKKREDSARQAKEKTDAEIKKIRDDLLAAEEEQKVAQERAKNATNPYAKERYLKEARNKAVAAQDIYGKKMPDLEDKSAALARQIADEESIQKRAGLEAETADYQKTAKIKAAEKTEKELARKRADEKRQAEIEQLNIKLSEEKDPEKARALLTQRSSLQVGGLSKDLTSEARAISEENIKMAARKQVADLEKERTKKRLQKEKEDADEEARRAEKASDQYDPHKGDVQRNGQWVNAKTGRHSSVTKEQESRDADLAIAASAARTKAKNIEEAIKNLDAIGDAMVNMATTINNVAGKVKTMPQSST